MKKFCLACLVALIALASCSKKKDTITIKGHVEFADPGYYVCVLSGYGRTADTLAFAPLDENNNYEMTLKVENPGVYALICSYWQNVSIWAEDEDLTVNFRGKDTAKIVIKNPPYVRIYGGEKNELMNELNYNSYRNYQNMIAISQAAYRSEFASEQDKSRLSTSLYEANYKDTQERSLFLLEKYGSSTSAMAIIRTLDPVADEELIETSLQKIEKANPGYAPAAAYREQVAQEREKIMRMKPGQVAPDFTVDTPDGGKVGPQDFRGKILLIDFWASWCGPCRGEVPNLKKYYEMFKDKGVEFLSVSIDNKEEAWRKAMEEEGMTWPQALAPNAGSELTDLYQFSGIPFIILLDQEGKIVAKNLRGETIKETIEYVLGGGSSAPKEKETASTGMTMMGMM
ncbi:MAG: TlpA family protein disulfide reductase [Bacteroidales bacterium]|nr:TlpA family protein disulfide reductase [Bacteroidales bacterium]